MQTALGVFFFGENVFSFFSITSLIANVINKPSCVKRMSQGLLAIEIRWRDVA